MTPAKRLSLGMRLNKGSAECRFLFLKRKIFVWDVIATALQRSSANFFDENN